MNDPKVYELLSKGLTRGIFQIESSGMKDVLKNLKADKFDDIVALLHYIGLGLWIVEW
ncbi:hypothetical protein CM15mP43_02540 [bacterium]|nr:MAG: hypothetical protein CM15mP43_02540 [bacterium]